MTIFRRILPRGCNVNTAPARGSALARGAVGNERSTRVPIRGPVSISRKLRIRWQMPRRAEADAVHRQEAWAPERVVQPGSRFDRELRRGQTLGREEARDTDKSIRRSPDRGRPSRWPDPWQEALSRTCACDKRELHDVPPFLL